MLSYEEVKELARQKGYSLRELADKTGYEFSGFYKALNRNSLKYESRIVLAEALGISMEELQGEITFEQRSVSYFSKRLPDSTFSSLKKTLSPELSDEIYQKNQFVEDFHSTNVVSEYRFLIQSLKEQLQSKSEFIQMQQKMIEELREKVKSLEEGEK